LAALDGLCLVKKHGLLAVDAGRHPVLAVTPVAGHVGGSPPVVALGVGCVAAGVAKHELGCLVQIVQAYGARSTLIDCLTASVGALPLLLDEWLTWVCLACLYW
jgi:hypothetical protein